MMNTKKPLLLVPVLFLLVIFILPTIWFISFSFVDREVARAFPGTLKLLERWEPGNMLPADAYPVLAKDLAKANKAGYLADAARRLNYEMPGVRSALISAAREIEEEDTARNGEEYFTQISPMLSGPDLFHALKNAGGPVTSHYFLASFDLVKDAAGKVVSVSEENKLYVDVMLRTLSISSTVTLCCLLLGFPVASLMARTSGRWFDLLLICIMIPFWTSMLVRISAWTVILQNKGIVNSILMQLGLITEPIAMMYNRAGVLVVMTHVLLPFMILPLYSVLRSIPPQYMSAAASLGANPFVAFQRVYLPLSIPGMVAGSAMVFILSIGYYITPALVGGGGDQMISTYIATFTTGTGNWGMASALGFVTLLAVLVLQLLAGRLSRNRAQPN